MKRANNKWSLFLHKIRFKYRVSILNENTLEESWHIRLSRASVFIFVSSLFLFTFILLTILIFATPVRYYLPGYGDSANRSNIIQESMRVDSMLQQMNLQAEYLNIVKGIVTGELKDDSIASLDSIALKERAQVLMEKGKKEREFVERYESEERFNLSSLETKGVEDMYVFFRPAKGVVSSTFNMQEKRNGIGIITSPNETVVSVLAGTVIYAAFTFDFSWVIQVQHENDYISIYKNNNRLLKKVGDTVRAGEGIAITGETAEKKTGEHFYFELWKQGKPLNPEDLIIF